MWWIGLVGCIALLLLQACGLFRPAPTATIRLSAQQGCAPLRVVFDGSESFSPNGVISSWAWEFGDGDGSEGEVLTHTYAEPGRFLVKLRIADETGLRGHAIATVLVLPARDGTEGGEIVEGDLVFFWDSDSGLRVASASRVEGGSVKIVALRNGHETEDLAYTSCLDELRGLTESERKAVEQVPDGYYGQTREEQVDATFQQLSEFLAAFSLPETLASSRSKHQITLMCAYAEAQLEKQGFDARIVLGPAPWPGVSGEHAWVVVVLTGGYAAIELMDLLTSPGHTTGLVYDSSISACPYYSHPANRVHFGIHEAVAAEGAAAFAWWE